MGADDFVEGFGKNGVSSAFSVLQQKSRMKSFLANAGRYTESNCLDDDDDDDVFLCTS